MKNNRKLEKGITAILGAVMTFNFFMCDPFWFAVDGVLLVMLILWLD